ncbi:hypothetical protein FQ377_13810 [Arthrobacter echini]|uniref:Uncharacterized protein n=1 Tax=Arthrobacter echini TaxID=1529066 RepID=A0A5D0XK71_9MICC|nr:hypothetical protein [Arthrobacter echini]TYC96599.1 hypothetical protein FQ377_13810 [Arthrobacter echini]
MTEQETNPWITAAQTPASTLAAPQPSVVSAPDAGTEPVPAEQAGLAVFLAAHGGAGATVWASALGGRDGGLVTSWVSETVTGGVVLVARSAIDGITAAKQAIAHHGAEAFTCVLAVAAAPGRAPRLISDELKILAGALPLVQTPWIPTLLIRRSVLVSATDIPTKDLTRITTELTRAGVTFEGETP